MVTLDSVLDSLPGKSVYFVPLGGNNGDALIRMGSHYVFEQRGISLVPTAAEAEIAVINGSGGVGVELWSEKLSWMRDLARRFCNQPMIVLPSAFYFQENNLAACFVNRTAPAYLFARDQYSYDRIAAQNYPTDVQIGLHDDMAFALRDSPFLKELKTRVTARHILLVERFDREATTASPKEIVKMRSARQYVPRPIKRVLKKIIHRQRIASSPFTMTSLDRLYHEAPQFKGLPVMAQDISSTEGFTFEQFTTAIANAAVVITTRLHVGILAALLDKPTYLIAGKSSYQKIRGVYEYSLSNLPHVHLW